MLNPAKLLLIALIKSIFALKRLNQVRTGSEERTYKAVSSLRGACVPLTTACGSPFRFSQNTFLELHVDKTTDNNGKKNSNVQT